MWYQETPEKITVIGEDGSVRDVHRGYGEMTLGYKKYARLPAGHPAGWYEAMGTPYSSFLQCMQAKKDGSFTSGLVDYSTN